MSAATLDLVVRIRRAVIDGALNGEPAGRLIRRAES
jgi:hypothetical protein